MTPGARRASLSLSFLPTVALAAALGLPTLGCEAAGVGDPCEPESVPAGGFDAEERYLETSSVQCRTRVCLVYELDGDPRKIIGDPDTCPDNGDDCVTEQDVADRIFCTCRCDAPTDEARECECPDGFSCSEILDIGSDGIRGSYCVRDDLLVAGSAD